MTTIYKCSGCGASYQPGEGIAQTDQLDKGRGGMVLLCPACAQRIRDIYDYTRVGHIRVSRVLARAVLGLGGAVRQEAAGSWYEYQGGRENRYSHDPRRSDLGAHAVASTRWDGTFAPGQLFAVRGSAASA